jgi:hypothetical protein
MPSLQTRDSSKEPRRAGFSRNRDRQLSRKSVYSESSDDRTAQEDVLRRMDTQYDLDKHRSYAVPEQDERLSRPRRYSLTESSTNKTDYNDSLTEEQRAWAGIDSLLRHDGDAESIDVRDVLSPEIIAGLKSASNYGSDYDEGDDHDYADSGTEHTEDSHDRAMKLFCGVGSSLPSSLGNSLASTGQDLPTLMESSFSSQMTSSSARSIVSYLSRNNIIIQTDLREGPLKNFLAEIALNLEGNIEEEEDEGPLPVPHQSRQGPPPDLDPLGQQIVNAIMMEMKKMRETDDYDRDDDVDEEDDYDRDDPIEYSDEREAGYPEEGYQDYDGQEVQVEVDEDQYYREPEPEPIRQSPPPKTSPKKTPGTKRYDSPKVTAKSPPQQEVWKASEEPIIDMADMEDPMDGEFGQEDDLQSMPSMATFQAGEVDKILGDQDPLAWNTFGDIQFDSSHHRKEAALGPEMDAYQDEFDGYDDLAYDQADEQLLYEAEEQQYEDEDGQQYEENLPLPPPPVRSVRDQIVSGVVRPHPNILREEPPMSQYPSTKAPTKKKKKRAPTQQQQQQQQQEGSPREGRPLRRSKAAPSPRSPQERSKSLSRSRSKSVSKKTRSPGPVDSQRYASPRRNPSTTSKVGRKPVSRPDEHITPKAIRKALIVGTPKVTRKAATRPGTPAGLTPRKSTSRTPGATPKVGRKVSMSRPPPTTPRKQTSMPMVPRTPKTPKTPKTPRRAQSARSGEEATDRPRQAPRSSVVRKPKLMSAQQRMSQSFSDFGTTKTRGPTSFDSQDDLAYVPEAPSSGGVRKKKVKGRLVETRDSYRMAAFDVPHFSPYFVNPLSHQVAPRRLPNRPSTELNSKDAVEAWSRLLLRGACFARLPTRGWTLHKSASAAAHTDSHESEFVVRTVHRRSRVPCFYITM